MTVTKCVTNAFELPKCDHSRGNVVYFGKINSKFLRILQQWLCLHVCAKYFDDSLFLWRDMATFMRTSRILMAEETA